ncbi:uncharacterized protein LOC127837350 isoform X2 [Dreissena polymorpha]|uniref:uncharacterized protein LOC127837350 isoform X2 n=1 Tax=Dreissena polymorpha TaxID=45954 RepID=UPI002264BD73|nr:uncharacterized protein LOC127837350 isoform X2 [Dreissena polymorpha]
MASSLDSVYKSSDSVKDYSCIGCISKNIEKSADFFCETCWKCFCEKCLYHHDKVFVNHLTYGRRETSKWPLEKAIEDLLLKCDIHNNEKLKVFCQDHSQLCCCDCLLLNHRQCTNLALISESVKKLSVDMQQLSNKIQSIIADLNKFKRVQEASIQSIEGSYDEKLQEIRTQRKKLNAALDELENKTLKELDEIRTTLQTSLKKDVDNCGRLKAELQQLSEAVQGLCDKSIKDIEFIARRKCLDKIQESESFLKKNPVKVQSSIIFKANIDIEQYLSRQSSLGTIVDSMQSLKLKMNRDQVLTVKRKCEYNVKISGDTSGYCNITGICSLPSGHIIITDYNNKKVKLLDKHYNVSSHCDLPSSPVDMCQITASEMAVTLGSDGVQFMSVSNGQLVNGRKLQLPLAAFGIAHHQGALYITSGTGLYHFTLDGTLVKKLYEVFRCALNPAGDMIYVTIYNQNKLFTLATDGSLIYTFTNPELQFPWGVHVTPDRHVLCCAYRSNTVLQVDHEGKKKLATLASQRDGLFHPVSVCYNRQTHQIIVGLQHNNKIIVIELQ